MSRPIPEDIRTLVHDVADATGILIRPEDPFVAAALIQSQLVREAGAGAVAALSSATAGVAARVDAAMGELESVGNAVSQQLYDAAGARNEALDTARAEARAVIERDLADARASLTAAAQQVLREVARGASVEQIRPSAWVGMGFLLGAATAFFVQTYLVRNQLNFITELLQSLAS